MGRSPPAQGPGSVWAWTASKSLPLLHRFDVAVLWWSHLVPATTLSNHELVMHNKYVTWHKMGVCAWGSGWCTQSEFVRMLSAYFHNIHTWATLMDMHAWTGMIYLQTYTGTLEPQQTRFWWNLTTTFITCDVPKFVHTIILNWGRRGFLLGMGCPQKLVFAKTLVHWYIFPIPSDIDFLLSVSLFYQVSALGYCPYFWNSIPSRFSFFHLCH